MCLSSPFILSDGGDYKLYNHAWLSDLCLDGSYMPSGVLSRPVMNIAGVMSRLTCFDFLLASTNGFATKRPLMHCFIV